MNTTVVDASRPPWWVRLSGWLLLLVLWEVMARAMIRDALLFPPPEAVAVALKTELSTPALYQHVLLTVAQTIGAALIALFTGVSAGILLGRSAMLRASLESPLDWLRSIPATALFPALMLFLGIGAQTRVALAAWGAGMIVTVNVMQASIRLDRDRLAHWRRAGLGSWRMFRYVLLGELAPALIASARVALSLSLVLVIVGEMYYGAAGGIGYLLVYHQSRYATASMYGIIVVSGCVGWALNAVAAAMPRIVSRSRRTPMLEDHVVT